MKKGRRIVYLLLAALLLLAMLPVNALAVGEEQPYSYNYDFQGNALPCPSPYEVRCRLDAADLGAGKLKDARGMFVRGDALYLADTGNNRVLQFALSETEITLTREIKEGTGWSLCEPQDVFVSENGALYIADTGNFRVLLLDAELNMTGEITKPDKNAFDANSEFKPQKLVMTAGGRLYVQADGVNKGLVEFNPDGSFSGYLGASPVSFDFTDYIWKVISTEAQRKQMESFVPTEYNNVALDSEGFLFVTTAVFDAEDLNAGNVDVVRRLNLKGNDILIDNDAPIIGDYQWTKDIGPSRFIDVTVFDNDVYYLLDSTRNRVFAYDNQGNSLYVFGGSGTRSGYFQTPSAIEHWGHDILVLDSTSGFVTVLKQTEYGSTLSSAIESYECGDYDTSYAAWQEVLRRNGNYRFAYDGIGKIMLRRGEYQKALDYLEYARDKYYFSKAWKLYRKDWIEQNLVWFVIAIAVLVVVLWSLHTFRREREALLDYEERERERAQYKPPV